MRAIALLCFATLLVAAREDHATLFQQFKAKYNRNYASSSEEARRFRIFSDNMVRAASMNSVNPYAKFGMNEFADLSAGEFKSRHNSQKSYAKAPKLATKVMSAAERAAAAGQAIDWRTKGAVTPVKNQGQCGSCWSFSTTGGIEGQWFLAGHPLTSVSEQELVSCDTIDQGCNGGLMTNAFTWLLQAHNGSIVTEASYPYVSGGGNVPACNMNGKKFGAQIHSFKNIAKNENDMAAFVYGSGPLSIGVDATSWQTYVGGIMTNCQSTQVDHGVLIVGFDENNSPPYWIIKNSWGASWGENGYIRVEKGTDQCLITSFPSTSEVEKNGPTPSPGPGPAPSGKTFTQKSCIDDRCEQCSELTFQENTCIVGEKASYTGSCTSDSLIIKAYSTRDCSGAAVAETANDINTCSIIFRKDGDRFVSNLCGSAPPPSPTTQPPSPTSPAPPTAPPAPTPAPTFPSGWINLFAPPFQNGPTIMMAISCIANNTCYVPGGENGAGFTTFLFNGEINGQFTPLQMPDMALMIMAAGFGGSVANPKGVVGGVGIGNGLQYMVNSSTLLPSYVPTLMVVTQDVRMTKDGMNSLVVDNGGSNAVLFSKDSGKTFIEANINNPLPSPNCTGARYGAMGDAKTWYVTLGNWPDNSQKHKTAIQISEAVSVTRSANGRTKRTRRMPTHQYGAANVGSGSSSGGSSSHGSNGGDCNGYSAMIVKTTDGGATFKTQVSLATDFYFNGIDCHDDKHCVAVGEGFNQNAAGHIWQTTDGEHWTEVFKMPSNANGQYSFMSVRFAGADGKTVWVGGSFMVSQVQSKGIFFRSDDGGATWKEYQHGLPDIGDITDISFLPDGTGFASAITIFDDSTILRYDLHGPPAPGYFKQSTCYNANCTLLCSNVSFPQGMCLQANGGGSVMAQCKPDALETMVYQTTDCSGSYTTQSSPLDKCLAGGSTWFENFCPKSTGDPEFARMPPRGKHVRIQ